MFIALEGVDGSGKSSLADAIAKEIRARRPGEVVSRAHHGPLKQDPLKEYVLDNYDGYLPGDGRSWIVDRMHWGELVYGPLYRDESALSTAQFRWIEMWMKARGGVTFRVTGPRDVILARLEQRGEDFLDLKHVDHVLEGFATVADSAITASGVIIPEGDTTNGVHNILDIAEYEEGEARGFVAKYPSLIGSLLPHTLLVGDKRGGQPPHPTESAFLPVNGNSGAFLLDSLPEEFWRGVAIVNGVEEGDRLTELVEDLYGPQVIALGRSASDVLLDLDIEHGGVPHPQFVRRFHNKRKDEYGRLIREMSRTGEVFISWPR